MNLSSDENNLNLSKFTSEITSQLLIQTNEPQEYVQIPNISDDLLLTSLDDGTYTWTLGGLPVLLNGDNDNQQLFLDNLPQEETDKEEEVENVTQTLNPITETLPTVNEVTYPLDIPDKGLFTEDGLFISNEEINPPPHLSTECDLVSNDNSTINTENVSEQQEEPLPHPQIDDIQSSDISSQETFIDINGLLIPQQSIINLENQDIFNLQDQQLTSENLLLDTVNVSTNAKRKGKRKTIKPAKKKRNVSESSNKKSKKNSESNDEGQNLALQPGNGLVLNCEEGVGRIKVLNLSDPAFSMDTQLLDVLRDDSNIVTDESAICETAPSAHLTEEPDSTVSNDPLNIDDLATVITAYQCKKCEFTCNNQEQFLLHFKETHIKIPNASQSPDPTTVAQEPDIESPAKTILRNKEADLNTRDILSKITDKQNALILDEEKYGTINIIYTNEEYTEIEIAQPNEDIKDMYNETASEETKLSSSTVRQFDNSTSSVSSSEVKPQIMEEELDKKIMRIKRREKKYKRKLFPERTITYVSEALMNAAPGEIFTDNTVFLKDPEVLDITNDIQDLEVIPGEKTLIYLCSQCAEQFLTVEDCKLHMINDHKLCQTEEDKQLTVAGPAVTEPEENDDGLINTESDLQNINKRAMENMLTIDILKHKKYKCSLRGCPYRFPNQDHRSKHEACHVNKARGEFKCSECNQLQSSWRLCSSHLWRDHGIDLDLFSCPLCAYKASTSMKLKQHLKIHSEEREYVCPDCSRGFKQASQLRNHRVIHMDRRLVNGPMWYIPKYCEKCGKMFADSKCLKKHIQAVHSKLKPFICNVCGHTCARKAMLQMHLRQHTGEKPYSCEICFYRTGDHNSLRRHAMRHTGVRPYKCPHCNYTAIQSSSYKNHLANKHPGMGGFYNCTECPFKTVNEDSFTGHQNDHKNGLIDPNKNNKTKDPKGTNKSNIIYDQVKTNSPETSETNENTIYTVSSSPQNIILVSGLKKELEEEDDETQNCYLSLSELTDEQTVDTGGITIPADPDDTIPIQVD